MKAPCEQEQKGTTFDYIPNRTYITVCLVFFFFFCDVALGMALSFCQCTALMQTNITNRWIIVIIQHDTVTLYII